VDVSKAFSCFELKDQFALNYQIKLMSPHFNPTIHYNYPAFGNKVEAISSKSDPHRIAIGFLHKARTKSPMNLDSAPNYRLG